MRITASLGLFFKNLYMIFNWKFTTKRWLAAGALLMALSIALGAFGAHALENKLSLPNLNAYKTGVQYLGMHAVGLILLCLLENHTGKSFQRERILMAIGMLLFCLSLFLLSTRSILHVENLSKLGMITPFGGFLLIASWIITALKIYK